MQRCRDDKHRKAWIAAEEGKKRKEAANKLTAADVEVLVPK